MMYQKIKEHLMEMAFNRDKVEERITGLGEPIVRHIVKVIRYHDPQNREKHLNDIHSWITQALAVTGKKGWRPDANNYHQWLFKDQNLTEQQVKRLHVNYRDLPLKSNLSHQEIADRVHAIGKNICHDMGNNSYEDIRNYI